MKTVGLLLGFALLVLAPEAFSQVTRAQVIETANLYLNFKWTPTERNIFHGADPDGIRVETPDASFSAPGTRPGWWKAGQVNIGMPYMWGGFTSPREFRQGLKAGKYAGDIYTIEKRRLLDDAVSKYAIGIDCSGLVSRCWGLERSYSTREFPDLSTQLGSYDELKPGDILNSFNNHVVLFYGFKDAAHQRLFAYEAGSPPSWKVLLDDIPVAMLKDQGYLPFRYKRISD
jgi:cell wall-associated NlpC family hydrolase